MNIQQIQPQIQQNNKFQKQGKAPQFTGAFETASSALRFLDTNQAWGANAVDLCSMVIPRTTVDFVNRGPEAGTETARRESMGTFNHSMVGVYGTAAGFALASMFNKKYGIRADKIFANDQTVDILSKYWAEARKTSDDPKVYVKNYTDRIADNIKFFNTSAATESGYVKLSHDAKQEFSNALSENLLSSNSKTIDKEFHKYIHSLLASDTGAETKVVLEGHNIKADNTLKALVGNVYNVSKTFLEKGVDDVFKANGAENKFVKGLKSLNLRRSILGLGIATAVGMSTQPINIYLTKKKTGSDGFVGVKGREKDNSFSFKILKTASASAFALGALSTITTNPKKFLNKIQFQGMTPTISQLKMVYGLTIASRLLSARDKDELRESAVKDTLGFLNLLVLGTLVTKGIARGFDKSLVNVTKDNSKNFFKWLTNSSLKTRDEVLYSALKTQGIKTVKDGKAIPFKELVKLADKETKGKLRVLNAAQIAGYLYSGLVLGIGVPKLNIYMTNKSEAKRKARLAAQGINIDENQNNVKSDSQMSKADLGQYKNMMKPENLAFLSQNM